MNTLKVIENWIIENSTVLDLGCGDGAMLERLKIKKSIRGYGVEIDKKNINLCLEKGLEVLEQNIDDGLLNFKDQSFDTVIVSETIQVLRNPKETLKEVTRIGKQSIIVIPNFGYWRSRLTVFLKGKMPITESLPQEWYETPNIHLCTISDFESLCLDLNILIKEKKVLNSRGAVNKMYSFWANLLGSWVIYKLSR
jgi:methionine biosynthesis protein MetW|tara:strand:- start:1129 stop:1716 length:588 start_codon:yes stop_codon:yes gene_type:complete